MALPPLIQLWDGPRDRNQFLPAFRLARSGWAPVLGDGLQELAVMPESHSVMTGAESAGLEQRILHARGLLLHRRQRLANLHRTHMAGAQVAYFFHLKKVEKSVALCRSEQASPFPSGQLPGVEMQNPDKIFSALSVHG